MAWHYSGVRPLPYVDASSTAAITRRHGLKRTYLTPLPVFSVIGGKLTTCRSLAEETAAAVLKKLVRQFCEILTSCPPRMQRISRTEDIAQQSIEAFATEYGLTNKQGRGVWNLWGSKAYAWHTIARGPSSEPLSGIHLPRGAARYSIGHEWATTLNDLVERRLDAALRAGPFAGRH